MIVRIGASVFIDRAAKYGVCEGIALACDLPSAVIEGMGALCGGYGIDHDRKIAACGVFHADRQIKSARGKAMLLILDRSCPYRNVGKHIV